MARRMAGVIAFLVSTPIHVGLAFLTQPQAGVHPIVNASVLLAGVAVAGCARQLLTGDAGRRGWISGVFVGAFAALMLLLFLGYALTYPAMEPPPFWAFLASTFLDIRLLPWLSLPFLLMWIGCLSGFAVARRLRGYWEKESPTERAL